MEAASVRFNQQIVNSRAFAATAALFACTYLLLGCLAGYATAVPAHDGGINDIDAIGNRNVGCAKGTGNWYSLEKQIALGRQISKQVESQSKVINDPVINEYINRVGRAYLLPRSSLS